MNTMNQTADTIARVAPSLVRETRAAHNNLLRQVQQRNAEPVYHYSIIKNVGHVQLAISTSYIPVDDETVHQTLGDGRGHILIASSVPHRRLARPIFDIVTRRSGQIKRRSGYRLWLAADGDSALLPDQPGRPVWRVVGATLVRAKATRLNEAERREGFARADRMLRRVARDA